VRVERIDRIVVKFGEICVEKLRDTGRLETPVRRADGDLLFSRAQFIGPNSEVQA